MRVVTLAAVAVIGLTQPLPGVVRQGDHVAVSGHVRALAAHALIALEAKRAGSWNVLTSARPHAHGRFRLHWDVGDAATTGPESLRVVALRAGHLLAATTPVQSYLAPGPIPCAPPVPPAVNIPVGSGWIEGGVILEGGPFPGINECQPQPYTITATDTAGTVAATMSVDGGQSYTLVVPAGTYSLTSGACRGQATVVAGAGTTANTYCLFP